MDRRAREKVEVIRVGRFYAGCDFIEGGGGDHGGIVAGEFFVGEEEGDALIFLYGGIAEGLISGDAAGEDDGVRLGVILEGFC